MRVAVAVGAVVLLGRWWTGIPVLQDGLGCHELVRDGIYRVCLEALRRGRFRSVGVVGEGCRIVL